MISTTHHFYPTLMILCTILLIDQLSLLKKCSQINTGGIQMVSMYSNELTAVKG